MEKNILQSNEHVNKLLTASSLCSKLTPCYNKTKSGDKVKITIEVDLTKVTAEQEVLIGRLLGYVEDSNPPRKLEQEHEIGAGKTMLSQEQEQDQDSNTDDGDLDADGLPWDGRIHSSNHKKTAKGVWARRKNVPDEVYNKVEAELKAAMAVPAGDAFDFDQMDIPGANVDAPPPPPPPMSYAEFAQVITKAITDGKVTNQQVGVVLRDMGIPTFLSISNREDLIPSIMLKLGL